MQYLYKFLLDIYFKDEIRELESVKKKLIKEDEVLDDGAIPVFPLLPTYQTIILCLILNFTSTYISIVIIFFNAAQIYFADLLC